MADDDLPLLFAHYDDEDAQWLVAFVRESCRERDGFIAHWRSLRESPEVTPRVIVADDAVVGQIASFPRDGRREVGYWLGRPYWGRGIASAALAAFLRSEDTGTLHARVAKDHTASLRVLEKNGFTICGEDRAFGNARGTDVAEWLLVRPGVAPTPRSADAPA